MKETARVDDLASIDSSADPEPWLKMLRGMWPGDAQKQARYRRLFGLLHLRPGACVLEVGCGAGGACRYLATTIDRLGLVIGVDPSQLAVLEASRLTQPNGSASRTAPVFAAMDGRQLGFSDGTFDAVFCSRVLVHAFDPETIVREMARVLRPGRRMLLVEPDRDGMLSSLDGDEVMRAFWSERRSVNPQIGRKLYPLLRRLDLSVEVVEPSFRWSLPSPSDEQVSRLERELASGTGEWWELVRSGHISEPRLRRYVTGLREARDAGGYLHCDLEFAYVARKVG